jgi:hypothetical protein
MTQRKLTLLGAAVLGAMFAMPAGAQDRNSSGYSDSGDRGVVTPGNVPDAQGPNAVRGGSGQPTIPSVNSPANVPDQTTDRVGREPQSPLVRDSRLRPSPITPGNVTDNNTSTSRFDRTNDGGMGYGRWESGRGGTR